MPKIKYSVLELPNINQIFGGKEFFFLTQINGCPSLEQTPKARAAQAADLEASCPETDAGLSPTVSYKWKFYKQYQMLHLLPTLWELRLDLANTNEAQE